jgi:hypothetical protein
MSEQNIAPAESPSPVAIPKFPRIVYKDEPVVSSDLLAKAYGAETVQIRKNFNRNKQRFSDGKHYHVVSGKELKALADGVPKRYAMEEGMTMPNLRGPSVTLYTKRGAALHAKMLETDTAWEVYEGMVDFYFDSMEGKVALPATKEQRRPLVEAVRTWVKLANADYAQAHKQVNAVVGVASVEEMTQDQVAIGLAWVRQRIDSLIKATETKAISEAEDVMVSLERLGMIIRKVREITKGLPVATEVALMRFFLNKSGYPTG